MSNLPNFRLSQFLVGEAWGGAERFFVKLAVGLEARGVRQQVIILRNEKRAADLRAGGCSVIELDFKKSFSDIFARWHLGRAIKRFQPDVFMAWMNRAGRRVPRGDFVKVGRLGGYYDIKNYRKCDWLIGNTPDLERHITASGWPADRCRMISNFGELEPALPIPRSCFDTPDDAFLIVALGRLHPSKGFDTLLNALSLTPGAFLWLAGDGVLNAELKGHAERLGVMDRVRFLGWRDDQAAILSSSDLCVVPSRFEPLSNVILEAWFVGTPVVATASQGPEFLIEDNVNGLLTPIDDEVRLAQTIQRLMVNPGLRHKLAQNGRGRWQQEYSEDVICAKFIAFFEEIHRKNMERKMPFPV